MLSCVVSIDLLPVQVPKCGGIPPVDNILSFNLTPTLECVPIGTIHEPMNNSKNMKKGCIQIKEERGSVDLSMLAGE